MIEETVTPTLESKPTQIAPRGQSCGNVRVSRASAVVVQRVPAHHESWFLDWQNGISASAKTFPGYQGTDLYPPSAPQSEEWVTVIHFTDNGALQKWLDSPTRAEWVEKFKTTAGEFDLRTLSYGFGFWFAHQAKNSEAGPPAWKMVIAVLVGLYPTAMLLTFDGPVVAWMGFAASMLLNLAISVCLLQWVVMPAVTRALGLWLGANSPGQRKFSHAGLCALLFLLIAMVAAFRPITG
jgi:antibiotic biosynthesis monooxygenase (ABM) superfamily enzyme